MVFLEKSSQPQKHTWFAPAVGNLLFQNLSRSGCKILDGMAASLVKDHENRTRKRLKAATSNKKCANRDFHFKKMRWILGSSPIIRRR